MVILDGMIIFLHMTGKLMQNSKWGYIYPKIINL